MVPLERFELPTLALRKPCSTPELQRREARGSFHIAPGRDLMPLPQRCKPTARWCLGAQRICAARKRSSEVGLSSVSACATPGSSGGRSGTNSVGRGRSSTRAGASFLTGGGGGDASAWTPRPRAPAPAARPEQALGRGCDFRHRGLGPLLDDERVSPRPMASTGAFHSKASTAPVTGDTGSQRSDT